MSVKTDPMQFGGGRAYFRKPYQQAGISRLLCSYAGCDRPGYATWGACADDNVQRPMCAEHDYACNVAALWMSGDPDADAKLDAYGARVEAIIGRALDLEIVYKALERVKR